MIKMDYMSKNVVNPLYTLDIAAKTLRENYFKTYILHISD